MHEYTTLVYHMEEQIMPFYFDAIFFGDRQGMDDLLLSEMGNDLSCCGLWLFLCMLFACI